MDNYAVLFGKSLGAGSGGSGTDNYNELTNKPSINGIVLTGNKTSANLGLQDAISDLAAIRSGAAAGSTAVQPAEFEADQQRQDALEAEDRAALIQQVNSGAKNRLNYNLATFGDKSKITVNQDGSITGSVISDTRQYKWTNREFEFTLPAGDYVFRIIRLTGDGVYTSVRLMTAENANLCTVATNPNIAPSVRSFTLDTDITVGFIGKVFTDTIQLMICTSADYTISPAFVPYRPSWQEMWEMIQALQNGASTQSTAALMSAKSTIDPDVMPEEGEKQNE